MTNRTGQKQPVWYAFCSLKAGEYRCLHKARRVGQQRVFLSGMRLDSGEWLILASNRRFQNPLEIYALRWEIEHLFQCLKGRGFHLEDTRLTRYFRIKKVMALQAIGFCWAHKTGEWKHKVVKPLKVKTHGRLEQSLFRYGLDHLIDTLLQGLHNTSDSLRLLALFLWPPNTITVVEGRVIINTDS